jgi:uncharacterized protein (DUF1697 family)
MKYIAFLRAINVGGHTVKMDQLRGLFEALGFSGVETFIASGNVIFRAPARDTSALEQPIEAHLAASLGYKVATFVRTTAEVAGIAGYLPFPADEIERNKLYVGFLQAPPGDEALGRLAALCTPLDEFHVQGRELYWLCRTTISRSKVSGAQIERALGMPTTLRNLTTVRKLVAKYSASPTDDIELINRNVDRLNAEMNDALAYQVQSMTEPGRPQPSEDFLTAASAMRERIAEWRMASNVPASDSTQILREMREE